MAEAEHGLDARAIVPGAVENRDLAGGWHHREITLEVPLPRFRLGWTRQRDHMGGARVEMRGEPVDRAALAGGVAALEDDHDALAVLLHAGEHVNEFDLKSAQLLVISLAAELVGIREAARTQRGLVDVVRQVVRRDVEFATRLAALVALVALVAFASLVVRHAGLLWSGSVPARRRSCKLDHDGALTHKG